MNREPRGDTASIYIRCQEQGFLHLPREALEDKQETASCIGEHGNYRAKDSLFNVCGVRIIACPSDRKPFDVTRGAMYKEKVTCDEVSEGGTGQTVAGPKSLAAECGLHPEGSRGAEGGRRCESRRTRTLLRNSDGFNGSGVGVFN